MMAFTSHPDIDNKRRIKEVVQTITNLRTQDAVVIICPAWLDLGFSYYYNQDYFYQYKDLRMILNREKIYPVNSLTEIDTVLLTRSQNVIYFEEWALLVDKNNDILKYLKDHFKPEKSYHIFESFNIHHFQK
jgi:hypothetical protein